MKNKKLSALVVGAGLIIAKFWKVFLLLAKTGGAKTLISMVVSLGLYAVTFGWQFGVALVYVLFIHEMGHLVAAKRIGLNTSPAIFIPFVGAVIGLKEEPKTARDEAFMAFGGPFFGLLSIIPALILWNIYETPIFMLIVSIGALINFFNLMPISPLDGGRIISVVSPFFWIVGGILLVWYTITTINFISILIGFMAFSSILLLIQKRKEAKILEEVFEAIPKERKLLEEDLRTGQISWARTRGKYFYSEEFPMLTFRRLFSMDKWENEVFHHHLDNYMTKMLESSEKKLLVGGEAGAPLTWNEIWNNDEVKKIENEVNELCNEKKNYFVAPFYVRAGYFTAYIVLGLFLYYLHHYADQFLQV